MPAQHAASSTRSFANHQRLEVRRINALLEEAVRLEGENNFPAAFECYETLQKRTDAISEVDLRDNVLEGFAYSAYRSRFYSIAVEGYRRLLEFRECQPGYDQEVILQCRYELARAIAQTDGFGKAIKLYRNVLSNWATTLEHDDEKVLDLRYDLAHALCRTLEYREALKMNLDVLTARRKLYADDNHLEICRSRYQVAINLYYLGSYQKALTYIRPNKKLSDRPESDFQDIVRDSKTLEKACKRKQSRNKNAKLSTQVGVNPPLRPTRVAPSSRSFSDSLPIPGHTQSSSSERHSDESRLARRKSTGSQPASKPNPHGFQRTDATKAKGRPTDKPAPALEESDVGTSQTRSRSSDKHLDSGTSSRHTGSGSLKPPIEQAKRTHRRASSDLIRNSTSEGINSPHSHARPHSASSGSVSLSRERGSSAAGAEVDASPSPKTGSRKGAALQKPCSKSDTCLPSSSSTTSQKKPFTAVRIELHEASNQVVDHAMSGPISTTSCKHPQQDTMGKRLLQVPDTAVEATHDPSKLTSDPKELSENVTALSNAREIEQHKAPLPTTQQQQRETPLPTTQRGDLQIGEFCGLLDMHMSQEPCFSMDAQSPGDWISQFEKQTLATLKPGDNMQVVPRGSNELRVAILDTGVDMSHEMIRAQKTRLKKTMSFVRADDFNGVSDDRSNHDPKDIHDIHGHGTHATALLLRLAPRAGIYVARVAKEAGPHPKAVARAIEHAHKNWKVDIIVMAFGFPRRGKSEPQPYRDGIAETERAIENAAAEHILMFGAACNSGNLMNIPFPARLPQVICINSADAAGKKSRFTPSPSPNTYNFSVLGEDVSSAWPSKDKGTTKRMSGTSTAVTIAAAVSAAILCLTRYQDESSLPLGTLTAIRERLKKQDAMCRLLVHMSVPEDGYHFIRPWNLINVDRSDSSEPGAVRKEILAEIAKFLRDQEFTIPYR